MWRLWVSGLPLTLAWSVCTHHHPTHPHRPSVVLPLPHATQPWQYEKYVACAWGAGYRVREEVVGQFNEAAVVEYARRNVHGVPLDKLQLMLDQWRRQ